MACLHARTHTTCVPLVERQKHTDYAMASTLLPNSSRRQIARPDERKLKQSYTLTPSWGRPLRRRRSESELRAISLSLSAATSAPSLGKSDNSGEIVIAGSQQSPTHFLQNPYKTLISLVECSRIFLESGGTAVV